jgi:hypothetical protein
MDDLPFFDPNPHFPGSILRRPRPKKRRRTKRSRSRKRTPGWSNRGFRPVGQQFRDFVVQQMPLQGKFTLREICAFAQIDPDDIPSLQKVSRAVRVLWTEQRLYRDQVPAEPRAKFKRPRWVYWRPGGA